jgi:glycosyltransferase involved in cell wall biosynthesis
VNISIITAVFNRSSTIVKAVKSVQQQTHPEVEHVVIDGASTDGTLQLLHECLHDDAILVSELDCGMYDAINKGIVRSSGEIIGLMHSDDVYANKHVLAHVADIFADAEIDAVYGDVAFFRPSTPEKLVRRYRSDLFNPERLAWGWVPAHTALFLRRRVFEQYGFYKINYKIASDYEFMARIFRSKVIRSKYLPNVLVHMRIGGVSTGGWRNTVLLNQEVLRACRENGIKTNMLKILSKYPLKIMEFL